MSTISIYWIHSWAVRWVCHWMFHCLDSFVNGIKGLYISCRKCTSNPSIMQNTNFLIFTGKSHINFGRINYVFYIPLKDLRCKYGIESCIDKKVSTYCTEHSFTTMHVGCGVACEVKLYSRKSTSSFRSLPVIRCPKHPVMSVWKPPNRRTTGSLLTIVRAYHHSGWLRSGLAWHHNDVHGHQQNAKLSIYMWDGLSKHQIF